MPAAQPQLQLIAVSSNRVCQESLIKMLYHVSLSTTTRSSHLVSVPSLSSITLVLVTIPTSLLLPSTHSSQTPHPTRSRTLTARRSIKSPLWGSGFEIWATYKSCRCKSKEGIHPSCLGGNGTGFYKQTGTFH